MSDARDPDYVEPVTLEELNQLAPAALHDEDCTGEPEKEPERDDG